MAHVGLDAAYKTRLRSLEFRHQRIGGRQDAIGRGDFGVGQWRIDEQISDETSGGLEAVDELRMKLVLVLFGHFRHFIHDIAGVMPNAKRFAAALKSIVLR